MVYAEARAEMGLERRLCSREPETKRSYSSSSVASAASGYNASRPLNREEIFISQIRQRAQLLDEAFQQRLVALIQSHSVKEGWAAETKRVEDDQGCTRSSSPSTINNTRAALPERSHIHRQWLWGKTSSCCFSNYMATRIEEVSAAAGHTWDTTSVSSTGAEVLCAFCSAGSELGLVIVHPAQPKSMERMREKVAEYASDCAEWPRTACILDPIRASVVCETPGQMLEVASWFLKQQSDRDGPSARRMPEPERATAEWGLRVCRVKNKFAMDNDQLVRDRLLSRTGHRAWRGGGKREQGRLD